MNPTVFILSLGGASLFGLALVLTQVGLRYLPPLQGGCVAIGTATVFYVALSPVTVGFSFWEGRSAVIFALVGSLFPAVVTILTFSANQRIGPNLTGALGNLAPLFAVILAVLILGETPGPWQVVAMVIIVSGVVLLYRAPRAELSGGFHWAFLLPLGAAFIRGVIQPLVKVGMEGWPNPFAAITIGYVVSTLIMVSVSGLKERGWPVALERKGWLWFAAVGMCNGLGALCLYQALASGPVALVAPLIACYPLATVAFARLIFPGTVIARQALWGIATVVVGVVLLLGL